MFRKFPILVIHVQHSVKISLAVQHSVRELHADWLILDYNDKATLNMNKPC